MANDIGPRIGIEGAAAFRQALTEINFTLRTSKTEMAALTTAYDANDKSAETLIKQNEQFRSQIGKLREEQKRAADAVAYATEKFGESNTQTQKAQQAYNKVTTEINNLEQKVRDNTAAMDGSSKSTQANATAIDALAVAIIASGVKKTLSEISDALHACVDASVDFESAMAGVAKTTNLSAAELETMGASLREMATNIPLTATELAGITEAAGQLGIAKEDLLGFTEVMANLGTATNMSADEAATALARFSNITGMSADNYERLGSTIVALGNNFATTESEITEMSTRLASAGTLAGLTETDILALATAMSSVGINAEAGGTAMTQTLTQIEKAVLSGVDSLTEFARISGMSADEFKTAWKNDTITAVQAFLSGLGKLEAQGESATLVLDDLGMTGIRQANMLKSLALASDELNGAIALSSAAWNENIALANEAATRYETTESRMQMLSNSMDNVKIAVGDQLKPALNELLDVGLNVTEWAADFIEKNEWVGPVIAGVSVALGVAAVALGGYAIAVKLAEVATAIFSGTLMTIPFVAVAAAVAGVVVAIAAFAAGAESASKEADALNAAVERTVEANNKATTAYMESAQSLDAQASLTDDYIKRLRDLESQGLSTEKAQSEYAAIIAYLNTIYPDLNAVIDENTGKVKNGITEIEQYTEAWKEAARAQALQRHLSEMLENSVDAQIKVEIAKNALELTEADIGIVEEKLNGVFQSISDASNRSQEDIEALGTAMYDLTEAGELDPSQMGLLELSHIAQDLQVELDGLRTTQAELTGAIAEGEAELSASNATYAGAEAAVDNLIDPIEKGTEAFDNNTERIIANKEVIAELTEKSKAYGEAAEDLSNSSDKLSDALAEQSEQGSLSISTIRDLIDSGYAAAIQVDKETGSVTVNRDAYIELANAKIQEQIAALQIDRAALVSALAAEASATYDAAIASGHATAEYIAQALAIYELKTAQNDGVKAYDAQIATLEKLKGSIGQVTVARGGAGGAAKTAAELEEEAAKKAADAEKKATQEILDAFNTRKKELDYLKKTDLVDEANYYKLLAQLRDEYLMDDSVIDEYRKVTEEIHDYQRDLVEETLDIYGESLDDINDKFKEALEETEKLMKDLESDMAAMESRLANSGDLFTWDKDEEGNKTMVLGDLQEQIDAIDNYMSVLDQLESKGVSRGLLDEIALMDVDDAVAYGEQLLDMSDTQLEEYAALWDEKQQKAKEAAEHFYKEQLTALETQYNDQLSAALSEMQGTAFTSGEKTLQALIDGMISQKSPLYAQVQAIVDNVNARFNGAFGSIADGTFEYPDFGMPLNQDINRQTTDLVNALGPLLAEATTSTASQGVAGVYLNGRDVGYAIIGDIRDIDNSSPEIGRA